MEATSLPPSNAAAADVAGAGSEEKAASMPDPPASMPPTTADGAEKAEGAKNGVEEAPKETQAPPAIEPEKPSDKAEVSKAEKRPASDEEYWKKKLQSRSPKVQYRRIEFEQFKNRYGEDDGRHIIEALIASPSLGSDISEEKRRRAAKRRFAGGQKVATEATNAWFQRVRIQSNVILDYLQQVSDTESWDTSNPRVFFRPFKMFIYFQPNMKKMLETLEEKWAKVAKLEDDGLKEEAAKEKAAISDRHVAEAKSPVTAEKGANGPPAADDSKLDDSKEEEGAPNSIDMDSVEALRHMRCYVQFVDKEIMPFYQELQGTSHKRVRFNDLWILFKVGDLVYAPPRSKSEFMKDRNNTRKSMYQTAFRIYFIGPPPIDDKTPDDVDYKNREFHLYCQYIDYDGQSFGAIEHEFALEGFDGEKEITKLGVYPMRYAKDPEKIQAELIAQGKRFQECIAAKHMAVKGWSLISTPTGNPIGTTPYHEYIESDVLIDFKEGFQHFTSHKPEFQTLSIWDERWKSGEDSVDIRHWSDTRRTKLLLSTTERTQYSDGTMDREYNDYLKTYTFMQNYKDGKVESIEADEYLVLLPRRLVAYVLRGRHFAMVDIESLGPIKIEKNAFDDLKINPKYKKMIGSLVDSHFARQKSLKRGETLNVGQDIIRGKGLGLVVLLHGVPGVGKTATAEAVAQTNKKPLFVITCGDLGISPKDVESSLNEIFRLAHLWDCVLLLDEADIFLSKRQTPDLKRNALVSVFLRVLEYYSGVLFLTTNRVGALDEAFKSRIHISVYYPPLQRQQTLDIFEVNIKKLIEVETERQEADKKAGVFEPPLRVDRPGILRWAASHFDNYSPSARWNGRQIRNAFQVASSLAYYDMRTTIIEEGGRAPHAQQVLDHTQFEMVADAMYRFNMYMQETTKGTDTDMSRLEGIRADDFDPHTSPLPRRPQFNPLKQQQPNTREQQHVEMAPQQMHHPQSQRGRGQLMVGRRGRGGMMRGGGGGGGGGGGPPFGMKPHISQGQATIRESVTIARAAQRFPNTQGYSTPSRSSLGPMTPTTSWGEGYDGMENEGYDAAEYGDGYHHSEGGYEGEAAEDVYQPDPEQDW